jgi:putative flippase GtrA
MGVMPDDGSGLQTVTGSRSRAEIFRLFLKFAGVGVFGTLAHYATLVLLVESFGIGAVFGSSAGFAVGALVNYLLNYRFTFQSSRRHTEALPRFYFVAMFGFLFNALIMWVLVQGLGMHYLISQILATGIVLIWNFAANLIWTFAEKKKV